MFRKISVKVAVLVNAILLVVIALGTVFLVRQQNAKLDQQYKAQAQYVSMVGAKTIGRLIEDAIDNGVFSVRDAFDTEYVEIPTFDPPKFHTRYDFYTDKSFLSLEDEFLKNSSIVYAVAVDMNGYLPTHNSRYQKPITGDREKDKVGNRTKRIFNDPVGITAAKNQQEGFIQVYKRDTGETMWDVSSPILVKGKQWGNFRIGLSIKAIEEAKMSLLLTLGSIMFLILVISTIAILYTVKYILQPLTSFTLIASRMADGEVDEKIVATSNDEIGELAEVLERMRVSLKSAMDRLMKK